MISLGSSNEMLSYTQVTFWCLATVDIKYSSFLNVFTLFLLEISVCSMNLHIH